MNHEDRLNRVFAALADPTRRAILARLSQGQATVGDVAAPLTMTAPAVSQHLKVLERAGLINRVAQAQWRTLTLQTGPLDEVSEWVAEQRREWSLRLDALELHLESMKHDQPTRRKPEETEQ